LTGQEFLRGIKDEISNHSVIRHPFWGRFEAGEFTEEGLRQFGLQYYLHVLRTRQYDAMVLARTPDEKIQAALAAILWDEYGCGDPAMTHPEQFRKLLRALGLKEADWNGVSPLRELETYIDVHTQLCQSSSIWTSLGVVGLAMEYPIPQFYERLVRGFLKTGLSDHALGFFIEHIPTDEAHSGLMEKVLLPHLDREEHQVLVREGVRRSLDVRHLLMDGLTRATFAK